MYGWRGCSGRRGRRGGGRPQQAVAIASYGAFRFRAALAATVILAAVMKALIETDVILVSDDWFGCGCMVQYFIPGWFGRFEHVVGRCRRITGGYGGLLRFSIRAFRQACRGNSPIVDAKAEAMLVGIGLCRRRPKPGDQQHDDRSIKDTLHNLAYPAFSRL